jgi:hypothetical protein
MAIGLYWWIRRPGSRVWPLLSPLACSRGWSRSRARTLFDIGVLAEAPFFVLTFYLFLAFPMGRLEPPAARWLMDALVLGVLAFFLPWAPFSRVIAGGGPLTRCAPGCPENVLQIGSAPKLVEVAGKAETYTVLAITAAVLIVYALRFRRGSGADQRRRPRRRHRRHVADRLEFRARNPHLGRPPRRPGRALSCGTSPESPGPCARVTGGGPSRGQTRATLLAREAKRRRIRRTPAAYVRCASDL